MGRWDESIYEVEDKENLSVEELDRRLEAADRFLEREHARLHPEPNGKIELWTGDEYMENEEPDCPFLVEGFLPLGYLVVLGGNSKLGKSAFVTAFAMAVAKGEPFLGMPTLKARILWCAYEEIPRERLHALRAYDEVPAGFHITHDCPKIDDEEDIEQLRWWIKETGAKLLVIDPLFGATTGSLTDGRAARSAMMRVRSLCYEEDCVALLIHHSNKDTAAGNIRERFAESSQILATASMDLLMVARPGPDGARHIRIQGRGRGEFANRTWLVRSTGISHYELMADGEPEESKSELRNEAIKRIIRESSAPISAQQVAEISREPIGTVRNRITALVKEGQVKAVGKKGRTALFACEDHHEN